MNLAVLTVTTTSRCAVWRACRAKFGKCRPENAGRQWLRGDHHHPSEGERYQGVVGLEGDTLAASWKITLCVLNSCRRACLFAPRRRRQTGCRRYVVAGNACANAQQDDFDHLATLTETIKTEDC